MLTCRYKLTNAARNEQDSKLLLNRETEEETSASSSVITLEDKACCHWLDWRLDFGSKLYKAYGVRVYGAMVSDLFFPIG